MTAVACLRILVGEDLQFADEGAMADLVGKIASSYLETRWLWPRRYGIVAPYAFVLADPRVTLLDPRELQSLAAELHQKLFGEESPGDVTLLTLEGDQREVMKFAGASRQDIRALLAGEIEGITTRVCKITRHDVVSVNPVGGSILGVPPYETLEPTGPAPARATFRGVYHPARQKFVGSALIWHTPDATPPRSGEMRAAGAAVAERDAKGVVAATAALGAMPSGRLFLPISFSTLIKPSSRAALTVALQALSPATRVRLTASVYDTPRAPSFGAMTQVRNMLDPFFAAVDLCVSDPAFQIDYLAADMARSVTLVLPGGSEKQRLAAIAAFLREGPAYRKKDVLQGVAGLRSRREIEVCVRAGAPFVAGPAVTDLLEEPIGEVAAPEAGLPLLNW